MEPLRDLRFFFKWRFLFPHMLRLFQNSFIFREATYSHFFRVTTLTQQLLFRSSYFFRAAAFFEELLFQNSHFFRSRYFFRIATFPSSYLLRRESSLGQLLFGTAYFLAEELFRIKISNKDYFFPSL